MKIRLNIHKQLKQELIIDKLKKVLFMSMLKMHELAVKYCPVNVGLLRNSINFYPQQTGFTSYELAAGKEYASHVEFGTKPHYVSGKMLESWSQRKLGNKGAGWAVAKKIAKVGTEAQPFMRPALDQVKTIWVGNFFEHEFK